ncbi:hypothetical protein V5N11_027657 [Cardamine amara subsp. amara]|uniref:CCHC-type domain-containing protein n=1 Tax=Cardamine amara subsp. amara TaxID=228776 RepID=A0ABD1AQT6_CARAN
MADHREESSTVMSNHKGENLFYTRCYVQSKICSLMIDERSSNNVASEYMVQKLGLAVKQHPWLDEDYRLRVSCQVKIFIAIGKYEEEILCDVQPMETCHILLGKPWQNERRAIHDGYKNRYSFKYKGSKFILVPMSSHEIQQDQLILKQRVKQFECHDTFPGDNPKESPPTCGEENQIKTYQEDIGEDFEPEPPDYALDNAKSMCEEEGDSEIKATESHIIFGNELGRHREEPGDKELVKSVLADPTQQQLNEMMISMQSLAPHGKTEQCKSSKILNEPTCYRCHKIGHFAIICPSRQFMEGTSLEQELEPSNGSESLAQSSFEIINSSSIVIHLSLPKGIDAGSQEKLEELLEKEERIGKQSNFFVKAAEDLEDVFPKYNSRSFPLIRGKEHQIVFDPGTLVETFPYDIQNKQGKEIIVADAIIPRYVFIVVPEAKLLEFEHIKRLYDSNDSFKNVFPSCEEFEYNNFFRHGGFLFDKTCEPNRNYVLMDIASFSNSVSTSRNAESFFGEIVYFDSTLNFSKHLDDHAEHVNSVLDNLSNKLFAIQNDILFQVIVVKEQDEELSFHATKTWLYHIWLKKNVVLELMERLRKEQPSNHRQCRMIFEPGENLWIQMKNGRLPNQTKINLKPRSDHPFQIFEPINDKANKKSLQGEYNLSLIFNFSNIIIFLADCSDLRSNPSQVGEDDVIMDSTKEMELEPEHVAELAPVDEHEAEEILLVPIGRMTQARLKKKWISSTTMFDPGI